MKGLGWRRKHTERLLQIATKKGKNMLLESSPLRTSKIHFYITLHGARVTATWPRVVRIGLVLKGFKKDTPNYIQTTTITQLRPTSE